MSMTEREDLERRAARVREHLMATAEELERKSGHGAEASGVRAALTEAQAHVNIDVEEDEGPTLGAQRSAAATERDEGLDTPERKQLERRADQVRERLADGVEALERKARQRLLPIVVGSSALVLVFTAGFAWMFYRTWKLSR